MSRSGCARPCDEPDVLAALALCGAGAGRLPAERDLALGWDSFSRAASTKSSEILVWVRAVATAVLAAVIAKLIFFAPGALAAVPLSVRITALVAGFIGFLLIRRSVFAGVATGEAVLIAGALLFRP